MRHPSPAYRVCVRTRNKPQIETRPVGPGAKRQPSPDPDFLWSLLALAHFMRLSLTKAAHAVVSSAACRKSGEGLGHHPQYCLSAIGAAPADEGSAAPLALPDLESVSQPFRAGLTFGSRPYGPGSYLLFISSSHADSYSPSRSSAPRRAKWTQRSTGAREQAAGEWPLAWARIR